MTERTTVRLPEDLVRRAKRKALVEGRSLTALIEDGLRKVLDEPEAAAHRKRVLPPVSAARGGLTAGIDLDDSAALQELEDVDAAGRLR
jgi:Arc/MetJ-type ribon-helix-helix transcriptional regulator